MQKTEKIVRTVLLVALIAYVIFVLWYTVFSRESNPDAKCYEGELFWSIRAAIKNQSGIMTMEIIYNCLMLIPVGFALAWLLSPAMFSCEAPSPAAEKTSHAAKTTHTARQRSESKIFIITVTAGFLLTCMIEILQLVLCRGLFEYDDIIYNTFGTMIGYLGYRISKHFLRGIDT